jgi:hypothetical protein
VVRHIFQARPVWIYTQSINITSITPKTYHIRYSLVVDHPLRTHSFSSQQFKHDQENLDW